LEERPSAENYPYLVAKRKQLIGDGTLAQKEGFLVFTKDVEFSSPSAAAVGRRVCAPDSCFPTAPPPPPAE
jgi:hypothetical protein